jgi:hypothetical protein
MEQRLTTDLEETQTVFPRIEEIRLEVDVFKRSLERKELEEEARGPLEKLLSDAEARYAAAKPEENEPTITLGFVPPAKLTSLRDRRALLNQKEQTPEVADQRAELDRELVRWGVRGHSNVRVHGKDIQWASEPTKFRGKEYQLAAQEMIDAYEAQRWLPMHWPTCGSLPRLVADYNEMSEGTKKKSS